MERFEEGNRASCSLCGTPIPVNDGQWCAGCRSQHPFWAAANDPEFSREMEAHVIGGASIAHYRLVDSLGEGGMGEVYLAMDTKLHRTVALKLPKAALAGDEQFRTLFLAEARAASALSHPNVCVIYEVGTDDAGRPFLAMEFVDGPTLAERIQEASLSIAEAVTLTGQIVAALRCAHDRDLMHGDLKPANVLLADGTVVKVVDFGLARPAGTSATAEIVGSGLERLAGTVPYLSPERAAGLPANHTSDFFSLGVLVFEMLTGRRPFSGSSREELLDRIKSEAAPAPSSFNDQIPGALDRLVLKCLEKDPANRYQFASEILMDLECIPLAPAEEKPSFSKADQRVAIRETISHCRNETGGNASVIVAAAISGSDWMRHPELREALDSRIRDSLAMVVAVARARIDLPDHLFVAGTPADAVRFAFSLQRQVRRLADSCNVQIRSRMAIGSIDANMVDDDDTIGCCLAGLHGMIDLARQGQILLTRSVFDEARCQVRARELEQVERLSWLHHGSYTAKNLENLIEIAEVGDSAWSPLAPPWGAPIPALPDAPVPGWRPGLDELIPGTDWRLVGKLGEGGFGEVWLGEGANDGRRRVFKFCFQMDRVRALKREATLSRLLSDQIGQHPNIVRLFEAILTDGPPFWLATEYVEGGDLRCWCDRHGGLDRIPLDTRLEIVAQAADGLQAAHDCGILHRDVKPGNLLMAGADRAVESVEVKLSDFGIGTMVDPVSRAAGAYPGFTGTLTTDTQHGTVLYLAPEVAAGTADVSIRSDIYSLGILLFQLLVKDFSAQMTGSWQRRIDEPFLVEDLERCCALDPDDRFGGAAELSRRLRALRDRQAARAREERAFAESVRQQRRHRLLAVLSVIGSILTILIATIAWRERQSAETERSLRTVAEQRELETRRYLYQIHTGEMLTALRERNHHRARALLDRYIPAEGQEDIRGFEWYYLWKLAHHAAPLTRLSLVGHESAILELDHSADRRLLVSLSHDGSIRVWDRSNGNLAHALHRPPDSIHHVAFLPDSASVALVTIQNTVEFWDPRRNQVNEWLRLDREILEMDCWSAHDRLVVAVEGGLKLVDLTSRETESVPHSGLAGFSLSRGGTALLTFSSESLVRWDWPDRTATEIPVSGELVDAAINEDATRIAVATRDGLLVVLDESLSELNRLTSFPNRHYEKLTFSRTNRIGTINVVANAPQSAEGSPLAWVPGEEFREFALCEGDVTGIDFSPDGDVIAIGDEFGFVKHWPINLPPEQIILQNPFFEDGSWEAQPLFSPDGGWLVAASYFPEADAPWRIRRWPTDSYESPRVFFTSDARISCCVFSNDGSLMAIGLADRSVCVVRSSSGETVSNLELDAEPLALAFSPNDSRLAVQSASDGAPVTLWDWAEAAAIQPLGVTLDNEFYLAFSPDGDFLFSNGGAWKVTDPNPRLETRETWGRTRVSADGSLIVCGSNWGLYLLNPTDGEEIARIRAYPNPVRDLAISPDGRSIVTCANEHSMKLWDIDSGLEKMTLEPPERIARLTFSPDGRAIAASSVTGNVIVWQAASALDMRSEDAPVRPTLTGARFVSGPKPAYMLSTGPYRHASPRIGHAATRWQISRPDGDFTKPLMDLFTASDLTELRVPVGVILEGETYRWRAGHNGYNGMTSEFSATGTFQLRRDLLRTVVCPIDLESHFNVDIILNADDSGGDSIDAAGCRLVEHGIREDSDNEPSAIGMPPDRRVGIHLLGDYSKPNAIQLSPGSPISTIPLPPAEYSVIRLAALVGNGACSIPVRFIYGDGTTGFDLFPCDDWFDQIPFEGLAWIGVYYLSPGVAPLAAGLTRYCGGSFDTGVSIFEVMLFPDPDRTLQAIVLDVPAGNFTRAETRLNILAMTGVRVEPSASLDKNAER